MTQYERGRRLEYRVIDHLRSLGFETMRAASSAGRMKIDVMAVRPGRGFHLPASAAECDCHSDTLFVQCKLKGAISPGEWNTLRYWAKFAFATPLLAQNGKRGQGIVYTELVQDRVPRKPSPADGRPYVFRVNSSHGFPGKSSD